MGRATQGVGRKGGVNGLFATEDTEFTEKISGPTGFSSVFSVISVADLL